MNDLRDRARRAGLSREWRDAQGRDQIVADDALDAILNCLDCDTGPTTFLSGDQGQAVPLPGGWQPGAALLTTEQGETRSVTITLGDGATILPPQWDIGYHRLEQGACALTVAIAPRCCPPLPTIPSWGGAVQIPSLRDQGKAYGDFDSLARAAHVLGRAGAAALAISPVHALFPADASRFSPYAPSSRHFRNIWLASAGAPTCAEDALIDWRVAAPDRMRDLRTAFDTLPPQDRTRFATWRDQQGEPLQVQSVFDALHGYFFTRDGAQGWQAWPEAYHDPNGVAVARFAADHRDAIAFYAFAQWRADHGLATASAAAESAGMAIGLIADMAIGVAGDGAHGWSRPQDLLNGLSIGAPPDPLGPDGQNWGIAALSPFALRRQGFGPFIAMLRAVLAHAGGIRIDHALGLYRLWVIPEGASADQGAYLSMPFTDLLRILKIEAQRARGGRGAIVIGEDLGTVPPGFRDVMADAGLYGMRVLPFERNQQGAFIPPRQWDPRAIAMTATHDIPTLAGWWTERDLEWRAQIAGRAVTDAERRTRADERTALWQAIGDGAPAPDDASTMVDAAIAATASAPCPLVLVPMEDLLGLEEQPNLPGTIDEHPNWRRRLPEETDILLADSRVASRIATLNARGALCPERTPR